MHEFAPLVCTFCFVPYMTCTNSQRCEIPMESFESSTSSAQLLLLFIFLVNIFFSYVHIVLKFCWISCHSIFGILVWTTPVFLDCFLGRKIQVSVMSYRCWIICICTWASMKRFKGALGLEFEKNLKSYTICLCRGCNIFNALWIMSLRRWRCIPGIWWGIDSAEIFTFMSHIHIIFIFFGNHVGSSSLFWIWAWENRLACSSVDAWLSC